VVLDLTLPAPELAPLLVGALLTDAGVTLRLTEVEAYAGADDPAAHAWSGPRPHTRDLFAEPGTLYCYRPHGLHICGNITCGPTGSAILFRAGAVVAGAELVAERRGNVDPRRWARGPGNLGRAMGWTLADSGRRFGDSLRLELGDPVVVMSGPRVGVSVAYQRPWRFWAQGEATVSDYRRSPRIRPGHHDW
jgi:DNA-3-methyladenine glycosylase